MVMSIALRATRVKVHLPFNSNLVFNEIKLKLNKYEEKDWVIQLNMLPILDIHNRRQILQSSLIKKIEN